MDKFYQELENDLIVAIDWLSFTIFDLENVEDVVELLGYDCSDFDKMPRGANGYKNRLKLKGYNLSVLYDGNTDMGIHIDVSGSAIGELLRSYKESLSTDTPFGIGYEIDFDSTFLRELLSCILNHGHVTRIDCAVDDKNDKFFNTDEIVNLYGENRIISKFRNLRNVEEKEISGTKTGHTLYFGSRKSDVFMRIYDKRLEQNKKNKCMDIPLIEHSWVRWELECKGIRAMSIVKLLLSGMELGNVIVGVLGNYFKVIDLTDSNRSRCRTNEKWESFMNGISTLRLFVYREDKTLEDKKGWLKKQVIPTLSAVILADGGSIEFISDNMEHGVLRMNNQLRNLVAKELNKFEKEVV